jgi:hypothetical protein
MKTGTDPDTFFVSEMDDEGARHNCAGILKAEIRHFLREVRNNQLSIKAIEGDLDQVRIRLANNKKMVKALKEVLHETFGENFSSDIEEQILA